MLEGLRERSVESPGRSTPAGSFQIGVPAFFLFRSSLTTLRFLERPYSEALLADPWRRYYQQYTPISNGCQGRFGGVCQIECYAIAKVRTYGMIKQEWSGYGIFAYHHGYDGGRQDNRSCRGVGHPCTAPHQPCADRLGRARACLPSVRRRQ